MREALFIAAFGVLSAGSLGAAPRYDAADPPARMEHPGPDQWSVCIGTASERRFAQPGGDTVSGSIPCVLAERDDLETFLNASYQDLRGLMRQRDSDAGVPPSEGATEALRQLAAGCHMYGHGRAGYSLDA